MFSRGLLLVLMVCSSLEATLGPLPCWGDETREAQSRHKHPTALPEGSTEPSNTPALSPTPVTKPHAQSPTPFSTTQLGSYYCAQKHHLTSTVSRSRCAPESQAQRPPPTLSK